jgi:hypothetical protein
LVSVLAEEKKENDDLETQEKILKKMPSQLDQKRKTVELATQTLQEKQKQVFLVNF